MNREQILAAVKELAKSQGFYGRLLETLRNNEKALAYLEEQKFGDVVDMVMFLED
jgi:hypothetical protein